MKKITLSVVSICVFACFAKGQSFYQLPLEDIDGNVVSLNSYSGKKILFFIAPLSQSDSNFTQLQAFKNRYLDTIKIIGVLSFEDGFQTTNTSVIKSLYSIMGIILTKGMYTRKTSGATQSPIMKWLTDKTLNKHYDLDASGIGHKFFVNGTGRQFAVMPPQVSLAAPIIDKIVHSPL